MSDPKVKPSIAARELGKDIQDYLGMQSCSKPIQEMIAKRIQLALGDLLEKAERREWLLRRIMEDLPSKRDWLDPALEREAMDSTLAANIAPWKTTI